MPRGSTYVDNSYNRSLGRVGMAMGSMSVSRTSSANSTGSHNTSSSKGSDRTYVDNSQNRSLGRVGMPLGSMSVSRSSGGSSSEKHSSKTINTPDRSNIDSSYSRDLSFSMEKMHIHRSSEERFATSSRYGDVSTHADSSYGAVRTYVDNPLNRSIGRVGKPLGSMPVSRTFSYDDEHSSGKTYVDNPLNRSMHRVGMPYGYHNVSQSRLDDSGLPESPNPYYEKPYNKQLDESSRSSAYTPSKNDVPRKVYVDNAYNRRLGRVGKPHGTCVVSRSKECRSPMYTDTRINRDLGLAGSPLGSAPLSKSTKLENRSKHTNITEEMFRHYISTPDMEYSPAYDCNNEVAEDAVDRVFETVIRLNINQREGIGHPYEKKRLANYQGRKVDFCEVELGEKIGHGGFGDVHVAKWNGSIVAVKKLRVQRVSKSRLRQFDEEVTLFCKLRHPNIIGFHGACVVTPNLCMIIEFMQGSLYDKLHIEEHQFSVYNKYDIVKGTIAGLSYLHDVGLAHCDIKSSNILINIFKEHIVTKITDFGLSIMKSDSDMSTSSKNVVKDIGTPRYSAPEVLNGELLSVQEMTMADVYSFGLVVFEIFSEEEPYSNLTYAQLRKYVAKRGLRPDIDSVSEMGRTLRRLVQKCWRENGTDRPCARRCKMVCDYL